MTVLARQNCDGLTAAALAAFAEEALASQDVEGKRVLCVCPDSTRSMPMPAMFRAICRALLGRAAKVDFLIALGTHPAMPEEAILEHFGLTAEERSRDFRGVGIFNHEWRNGDALTVVGRMGAEEVEAISEGLMREEVEVAVNRRVLDHDLLCVVGPVFPHEVAGFSGGNKYFFPGIAGEDILNLFHWLGALITNPVIIGTKYTPVRKVIDTSAAMIPTPRVAFCLNVVKKECRGIWFGTPEEAWDAAADAAAESHIVVKDRPYESVLAMAPAMYQDIWVAGKCMYKLEPIVADGGELIIYGPHIRQVSVTHGELIKRIGYHTRDYFLAQMEKFRDVPGGILAHSTHVRGIGTYDNGVESPRVKVTLATGIPEAECRAVNLGHRDPATIDPELWRGGEDGGRLLVEQAGEVLYRLKQGNPRPRDVAHTAS